jgi:hypothetical protein
LSVVDAFLVAARLSTVSDIVLTPDLQAVSSTFIDPELFVRFLTLRAIFLMVLM